MPLDRHAQRFLKTLALSGPPTTFGAPQRRRDLEALCELGEIEAVPQVTARDLEIPGPAGAIPARLYTAPAGGRPAPLLVYLHGGGWVAGGLRTHDGVCRRLAEASACLVLAVDYRLAPEHPFPAGLEDARASLRWAFDEADKLGADPARIGLAGDSAGANLATAVALGEQQELALLLLICPILDLAGETASRVALAQGYFLDQATMAADLADYLPAGVDPGDPRLSPLRALDLSGLPPTLIHSAEFDPFHDEAVAFAKRLQAAGLSVRHTDHPGMIHYFYALPRAIPYALEANAAIGEEVRRWLGT
jgi:acetyl esterase/lipase